MPHDQKGQLLNAGDKVSLTGTVLAITSEQPTYCNITLRPDETMAPESGPYDLSLSARMVEKVQSRELSAMVARAYDAYCAAVGGVAFNGDPLPSAAEFFSDPQKEKQAQGWIAAVEAIFA